MACPPQQAPSFKLSERINKALWTMRNAGLAGVSRRKGTVTTVRDGERQAPDLVDRNFIASPVHTSMPSCSRLSSSGLQA
jgi:hypothetical protein